MRTAIYTRISSDPTGRKAGVARQEKDCRSLVDARGWDLVDVYSDNDKSAYAGRVRPDYERLLTDIEAGHLDALVAWHPDRLHRSLVELERFIDVVESHGVAIATVQGGEFDLSTASGKMTARIIGSVARHESEHKSERHKAKAAELAMAGMPSGGGDRPFGYDNDRITIREDEAALVKDAAARLISGESIRSLVRQWNEAGIKTTAGNQWHPANFTRMMRSARIAGLRSHRGEVVAEAVWPGIITSEDHRALTAIFAHNAGRLKRAPRKYLATSGLAVCGLCGADLVARPRQDGRRCYVCARGPGFDGCGKIRVLAEPFEEWIRDSVIEALAGPALAQAIAEVQETDSAPIMVELESLEDSLHQLSIDHYSEGLISRSEYFAARASIEDKIKALTDQITTRARSEIARGNPEDLLAQWESRDLGWRRQLVELVIDKIVVNSAVRGRNFFDPGRFDPRWKI